MYTHRPDARHTTCAPGTDHILTDAYPKLVPSSPLAMSVNCWAASLVLFGDLDLHQFIRQYDVAGRIHRTTYPTTALTNARLASGVALDCTKSSVKSISFIHSRVSDGYFDTIMDNSSMRFCVADLGATPANPERTARRIGRPCARNRIVPASPRSSLPAVRRMSVS